MTNSENPLQTIDISEVTKECLKELLNAATTQGFLFVEGHGFSQEEVTTLFQLSKQFFELPKEYKEQYPISKTNHGYSKMGEEALDDLTKKADPKEALNFACLNFITGLSSENVPDWFEIEPERLEIVKNAGVKLYELSVKILKILAIGLEIEDSEECKGEDWFTSRYAPDQESGTTFRFLHYPGQQSELPEEVVRAGAHTDYGSMTLLFQQEGEEGLQIYSPVAKKWQPVPFVGADTKKFPAAAPPIVVNIADQLSYWTAGLLKLTIHRVVFPPEVQESGKDRYSIVFFSHPNDDTQLEPVPSPLVKSIEGRGANKAGAKVITAREHLDKRLASTYGWY